MRGSRGAVTTSLDFLIDPLGFGVPVLSDITISGREAVLDIGSFTASTSLGKVSTATTAFVTYDMNAAVAGVGLNVTGGKAMLGDSFGPSDNLGAALKFVGVTTPPVGTIAEPSPLALVWLGVALLDMLAPVRRRAS